MSSNEKKDEQLVDELMNKYFPPHSPHLIGGSRNGNLSDLLPHQTVSVRALVKEALATGKNIRVNLETGMGKLVPRTRLEQEILNDAVAFEKTLQPSTNTSRVATSMYPWGWRYEDADTQTAFRRFCQTNIKA